MDTILNKIISDNPELKPNEVFGILQAISTSEDLTSVGLITLTGLPRQTLKVFKTSIAQLLVPSSSASDVLQLNFEGEKLLSRLNLAPYSWSLKTYSSTLRTQAIQQLQDLRAKNTIVPKRELDQFFATPETSVDKALVLIEKGVIKSKSLVLLGDDDLVSVTLLILENLLNQGQLFNDILVLDIDTEILTAVASIYQDLGANPHRLKTEVYDARKDLKPSLLRRFDAVMTDPPYTKAGTELFLKRSLELLKPHKNEQGQYIFLCHGVSFKEPYKMLKVQELVQRTNLLIEDKINKFNRYCGAESIGNASALYILKTTPATKVPAFLAKSEIYTFENTENERFPYVDHFVFKLTNVPAPLVSSKKALLKALGEFCKWHRLKVVDSVVTKFKGGGLTITFILANSNLVVHTWPEYGALHIDLITCTPVEKKDQLAANLHHLFKTKTIEIRLVE